MRTSRTLRLAVLANAVLVPLVAVTTTGSTAVAGDAPAAAAVRINVGGGALTDVLGRAWVADQWFQGGAVRRTVSPPDSTAPRVDRTGRAGTTTYGIPTGADGTYTVLLHSAPQVSAPSGAHAGSAPGVQAEGVDVPSAAVSGSVVSVPVPVVDGRLDLVLRPVLRSTITGIEVLPPVAPVRTAVTLESFGAVGDGRTDDTAALQRALDAGGPTTTLVAGAGRTYLHADVLHVRRAGTRLSGPGTVMATDESRSSVWVEADDVVLDGGLTLTVRSTTTRWGAWEQMGLRVVGHTGLVARDITVSGSAAAGIYVGGQASDFLLDRVTVRGTRADGIHMTAGAHHGQVVSPTVVDSGDDGVAVVSYQQDGEPVHDVTVTGPRVLGTTWGRGLSVVGGTDITYRDVHVERSSAAAVYLAGEGAPWHTAPPVRVTVEGGDLVAANSSETVDHGAVVVLAAGALPPQDVVVAGLSISGTRRTASRDVGVITYAAPPRGVVLRDLQVTSNGHDAYSGNTPGSAYQRLNWTVDGTRVADHLG